MNEVRQLDFEGKTHPATGNRVRDQLAAIMETDPDTQGDEDLLAAVWIQDHTLVGRFVELERIKAVITHYRKADIGRRRRELRGLYPYSADEEERRQKRGRGGPP